MITKKQQQLKRTYNIFANIQWTSSLYKYNLNILNEYNFTNLSIWQSTARNINNSFVEL